MIFSRFSFAVEYDYLYFDGLPTDGYRELATSQHVSQENFLKTLEYVVNSKTVGYLRRKVNVVRHYQGDKRGHVLTSRASRSWFEGLPVQTDRMLDFAIVEENKAFFTLELPGGRYAYTRDGRFEVNHDKMLVSVAGHFPVLSDDGAYIVFGNSSPDVTISRMGLIYDGLDAVARLKITCFKSFSDMDNFLESLNGVVFVAEGPDTIFDKSNNIYGVHQGFIQYSNSYKSFDSWYIGSSYTYLQDAIDKFIEVRRTLNSNLD